MCMQLQYISWETSAQSSSANYSTVCTRYVLQVLYKTKLAETERGRERASVGAAAADTYKSTINGIVLYAHSRISATPPLHRVVRLAMATHLKSMCERSAGTNEVS